MKNAPIIIFAQDDKILTTIQSYDELSVQITRAACSDTKKYFYLVELTRRAWSQADPDDFCGHVHRAGLYRTKSNASDEILRLWHVREKEPDDIYFTFKFKPDPIPIHALEITNLRTNFI